MQSLDPWIADQYRHSVSAMMRSVSPTGIVKSRPGFGQLIKPLAGAIVASPELAAYDPDPDYFFHWHRDSAIVIDAVRLAAKDAALGIDARRHIEDFVSFGRSLQRLDGRLLVADSAWRERIAADFRTFVRPDAELGEVFGTAVDADTRFNPDGTLDISRWGRPQTDGPALRALALLRWASRSTVPEAGTGRAFRELLQSDLAFVQHRWRDASFDIWEEEKGQHYYTLRVAAAALDEGAAWLRQFGENHAAEHCSVEAAQILRSLDGYWSEQQGHYRSRVLESGAVSAKELDIAVILAAIHSGSDAPLHSVRDPRMHRTLERLESLFAAAYPINQRRPDQHGVAMGRYAADVYYSGGAYFFSTLGAAEFCYRAAAADSAANRRGWLQRGDAFLNTVRRFTPAGGALSEQFDQRTGEPRSARNLAWSYAAFITCIEARRHAHDAGLGSTS